MGEEFYRRELWEMNLECIEAHNNQPGVTYTMGVNSFTDMTPAEIRTRLGLNAEDRDTCSDLTRTLTSADITGLHRQAYVPETVDLREAGCINHVKDQGACGSCYTFGSVGALESYQCMKTGQMVSLSEQNVIECSWDQGNLGCNGGIIDQVFQYVQENGGIDTEAYYPYTSGTGVDNGTCYYSANPAAVGGTCSSWVYLPERDEDALKRAIAQVGPISIAYDVTADFVNYESGVFSSPDCSQIHLNHAMLLVGYGTENDQDFWLIKNSWGADWGDEGFIKVARNMDNNCGIASCGVYPVV